MNNVFLGLRSFRSSGLIECTRVNNFHTIFARLPSVRPVLTRLLDSGLFAYVSCWCLIHPNRVLVFILSSSILCPSYSELHTTISSTRCLRHVSILLNNFSFLFLPLFFSCPFIPSKSLLIIHAKRFSLFLLI